MPEINRVKDVWATGPTSRKSTVDFYRWFNDTDSVSNALKNGFIDFSYKIFLPDFYEVIGDPKDKTALEIGFGAGRLLNAASNYFGKVIGVDIHQCFDRTSEILKQEGRDNFELVHRDNIDSIQDASIDFVYSFIVFQHFSHWSEAEFYISHIERVLKPGGCGMLYMGINERDPEADYVESGESWDDFSLLVKPSFAVKRLSESFRVIQAARPSKSIWGKYTRVPSGQFFVMFVKPLVSM